MKIGMDARMIQHSGIGTYIRELLEILLRRPGFDWTLYGEIAKIANYDCRKLAAPFPIYSLSEQALLPGILAREPQDLLHFPHYNVPLGYRRPFVVTLHDLIHLRLPKSKLAYFYARTLMQSAVRRARLVLADSECTRRDLLELLGADERKIRVVYPGVSPEFAADVQGAEIGPQFQSLLEADYMLYVGNVRESKNTPRLIEAFEAARRKNPQLRIILAGRNFMPEWTARYRGRKEILFLGEVTRPHLLRLYRRAKMFVFPSLYEGFGLPPLEAMSCGIPVISSDAASLPEVVGDAALTFDPWDASALSDLMLRLWDDAALHQSLIEKGRARAKMFSWTTCADQTEAAYREALA